MPKFIVEVRSVTMHIVDADGPDQIHSGQVRLDDSTKYDEQPVVITALQIIDLKGETL